MNTQKGFSIAEIAVAMAVFSFMALGVSTLIQNQANKVYYLEDQVAHQNLQIELKRLIENDNICIRSLQNVRLPAGVVEPNTLSTTASPFAIRGTDGDVRFDTNRNNEFESLKITGINVQNIDLTNPAANNVGRVQVRIDVARNRGTHDPMKSIFINQNVEVNPSTRAVTSCNGGGSGEVQCLEQISGSNGSSSRIPADAKVIRFTQASYKCNNSTDNDTSYPGYDIWVPIENNRTGSGQPIVPGQNISANDVVENVGGNPRVAGVYRIRAQKTITNVPVCYKNSDYAHDLSEGWCASGPGRNGISFYK